MGQGLARPMVKGTIWGQPGEDAFRFLWSGQHPEQISLIRGNWQGEKQDGFLAEVSPRTEFGASVLLETNEPIRKIIRITKVIKIDTITLRFANNLKKFLIFSALLKLSTLLDVSFLFLFMLII